MTSSSQLFSKSRISVLINRLMYALFVLLGAYYFFFKNDISDAMSTLGIALIFDPFNQTQSWKERPSYQKSWLIIHVTCVMLLLAGILLKLI